MLPQVGNFEFGILNLYSRVAEVFGIARRILD
jgi:hypothetical protein